MDRRTFVKTAGTAAAAADAAGIRPDLLIRDRIDKIGLQLYTVRGLMQASVERTLSQVAAIGYKEVEFAGYFNRPPRAIKQLLDDNGLGSPAAHIGLDALRGPWNRTLSDASEIGHKWLVIASTGEVGPQFAGGDQADRRPDSQGGRRREVLQDPAGVSQPRRGIPAGGRQAHLRPAARAHQAD